MKKLLYGISILLILVCLTVVIHAQAEWAYDQTDLNSKYKIGDILTYNVCSSGKSDGIAVGTLFIKPSKNLTYISTKLGNAVEASDKIGFAAAKYGANAGAYGISFRSTENIPISEGIICSISFRIESLDCVPEVESYWYDPIDETGATIFGDGIISADSSDFTVSVVLTGDLNGDEAVDSDDAIHLLYYTLIPDLYPVNQNCDFDGNGEVNSDDAIYLLFFTLLPDIYPLK